MKCFYQVTTFFGLFLLIVLFSFSNVSASDMLIGMLTKIDGANITVRASNGNTKDFRLHSGSFITNIKTREVFTDTSTLKVGSRVRVSNKADRVFALEVLEVPK